MFLNPWYGGERPPTANGGAVLTQHQQQQSPQHCTQQTQHSPLSSASHSPHNSPTPGHRITLSQSSNSPSPSPTLLPRSSFLHSHLAHLNSSSAHNSSSATTSSSNTSSPVLCRATNNNSSYSPSNSPRLGRNFNTFNTPHCLQTTINISSSNTLGHVPSNNSSPHHNSHPPNSFPMSIINNPSQHNSFSTTSSNSSSANSTTSSHLTLLNNTLPRSYPISGGGIHSTFTNSFSSSLSGPPLPSSGPPSGGISVVRTVQGAPPLHVLQNLLDNLQMKLRPGWTVHCTTDGRYFYCK